MYDKPYHFWPVSAPEKHIVDYKWRERKTDQSTFMFPHRLPFDTGYPGCLYTLTNPESYDLIYDSEVTPDIFTKRYDILPNNGTAPLVNKKVKDILEKLCPNDVQFFPVTIKNENNKIDTFQNHDYWLLNICSLYDDVDFEKSELQYLLSMPKEHQIKGYKKCVFKELHDRKIPHIGRLIYSLGYIVANPELMEVFKKEKIKGIKFIKEEDFPFF